MANIQIQKEDCSACCTCCGAANFESRFTEKKVEALYYVRIGGQAFTLCEDCKQALAEQLGEVNI